MVDKGIIILDKPCGHTSHEITSFVKKITNSKKSGHAGTLDPNVSGVLPIALGKDTKMLRFIAGKDKIYVGIIKFKQELPESRIKELFSQFVGEIEQTPPKISAVKKKKRKRNVFYLNFLEKDGKKALFETKVSAGTYIRTLCVDIGKKAKIPARMEELRRISVGDIKENQSTTMQELIDAMWLFENRKDDSLLKKIIKPIEKFLNYKKIKIKNNAADALRSGAQLMVPGVIDIEKGIKESDFVTLYSENNEFVGIGKSLYNSEEFEKKKKGLVVKTERIY